MSNFREQDHSVRLIGAQHGDKYSHSTSQRIDVNDLIRKYHPEAPRDLNEQDRWMKASSNLGDLLKLSTSMHKMVEGIPSYEGLTIGGSVCTSSHGNLSRNGTLSNEVDSLVILDGNLEIQLVNSSDEIFPTVTGNLGAGAAILWAKMKMYPERNYEISTSIIDKDELIHNFINLKKENESLFFNVYLRRRKPIILMFRINESDETSFDRESNFFSDLESFGIKFQHIIPASIKKELRFQLTKLMPPNYQYQGNQIHRTLRVNNQNIRAMQRTDIVSHEISFDLLDCKEVLNSLLNDLPNLWHSNKSSFPINIRISGSDIANMSPTNLRESIWIDFITEDANGFANLEKAENWHIAQGFSGRPHFGKWLSFEKYDFPRLYPKLNTYVADINKLDPKGRYSSDFIDYINRF